MPITSSKLGSSLGSSEATELSFVRTLLRSVAAVPGADEAVSWDLKLERSSSPASQGGGAPPAPGDGAELSARLGAKGGRAPVRGGPVTCLGRGGRNSNDSALTGGRGDENVDRDLHDDAEGRRGCCCQGSGVWGPCSCSAGLGAVVVVMAVMDGLFARGRTACSDDAAAYSG